MEYCPGAGKTAKIIYSIEAMIYMIFVLSIATIITPYILYRLRMW